MSKEQTVGHIIQVVGVVVDVDVIAAPAAAPSPAPAPERAHRDAHAERNRHAGGIVAHRRIVNGWIRIVCRTVHRHGII